MKVSHIILAVTMLFIACNSSNKQEQCTTKQKLKGFTVPSIPNIIPHEEHTEYLSIHFWDNLNLNDTTLRNDEYRLSSYFVRYLESLNTLPVKQAHELIKGFIKKIHCDKEWFDTFQYMASYYLYNISSPLLNEELYIPFAQSALESNLLTEEERIQYSHRLEVAQKNNPGNIAADFKYIMPNGKENTMHRFTKKAEYILLFFHDFDCENCKAALSFLANNKIIDSLSESGTLQPLMIYTEGDDELWRKHKNNTPKRWDSGYDRSESIRMKRIYELRAMPSIYLIDKKNRVVFKDITPEKLLQNLSVLP